MNKLPEWNGWTIDIRLKQFRKVGESIEFVDFRSDKGYEIFKAYCEDQYKYHMETGQGYERIILDIIEGKFNNDDADIIAREMFNGST